MQPFPFLRPSTGTTTEDGRHIREENPTIDLTRMGNEHAWDELPVHHVNYHHYVVNAGVARRNDMQRWQALHDRGEVAARRVWSRFIHRNTFFFIPQTVPFTTRTFARDQLEAVYVDTMARAIQQRRPVATMTDVPLFSLLDGMLGRRWNAFHTRGGFLREAYLRAVERLMVPYDSHDVDMTRVAELRNLYPPTPTWYDERWFPNAVPVPTPPLVFYFHELFRTGDEPTLVYLREILRREFALLFIATWWHDARRGGIGIVTPEQTVQWLTDVLRNVPIDPDSPFGPRRQTGVGYITQRMREVNQAARQPEDPDDFYYRNDIFFPQFPGLRPSRMVFTLDNGRVDEERPGGRRFFRDPRNLREYNVPLDQYGNAPRVNRRTDMERVARQQRLHELDMEEQEREQAARQNHERNRDVLGRRGRDERYDPRGEGSAQRRRMDDPLYESYFGPAGAMQPNQAQPRRAQEHEWGYRAPDRGDRQHRDYRPRDMRSPPRGNGRRGLDPRRMRIREIDMTIGPSEYYPTTSGGRGNGGRQPHGQLSGAPAGLFSAGRIPRRGSRLNADRNQLVEELRDERRRLEEAIARGGQHPGPLRPTARVRPVVREEPSGLRRERTRRGRTRYCSGVSGVYPQASEARA